MRLAAALIFAVAVTAIVGSSLAVITKDRPASLAVSVEGLPGYVYYDRAYDITIAYENHGGAVNGPVELSAWLPPIFALSERIEDPTRRGERLTWVLDGLGAGERGFVEITVQGTLPADLSEVVYDLPGYAGHTALVGGFELAVTLTAGSNVASALAVSDTGAIPAPAFSKLFAPDAILSGDVSTLTFTIDNTGSGVAASRLAFTDTLPAGVVVANPENDMQTCGTGILIAIVGSGSLSYSGGSVGAGASCTVQVDVTSSTPGAHVNTSGDLTSSAGNSGTATDTLTVVAPTPTPTPEPFFPDPDPSQFPKFNGTAVPPPTAAPTQTESPPEVGIKPPATGDGGLR